MTITANTSDLRLWHLDVPLTYPIPPAGTVLTITLATAHALPAASGTGTHIVLGVAAGRLVLAAQFEHEIALLPHPMVVLPDSNPAAPRIHLTAVRVRVIDADLEAIYEPGQEHLTMALTDASDDTGDGPGIFGAATQLPPQIAVQLAERLFPSSPPPAPAEPAPPKSPTAHAIPPPAKESRMPNFVSPPAAERNFWAHEVAHNFCPPSAGAQLILFASTVGPRHAIHEGDLVLAFARKRLVMVTRVVGSSMPPELQVSIELSQDSGAMRGLVGAIEVEVQDVDVEDVYDHTDCECLLSPSVNAALSVRHDLTHGDARPFGVMGCWVAQILDLD